MALAALLAGCESAPEPRTRAQTPQTVSFLFVGDIFLHSQNIASAWDEARKLHDFDRVFERVRPTLSGADYAGCWLGGEFSNSPPYRGYPLFRAPAQLLHSLKRAGFDICLATNHIMDGGLPGLRERVRLLDSLELLHPGEYVEPDSTPFLVLEKDGVRVCILSYTYGTNGLPVPEPWMVNLIDTTRMAADIKAARRQEPDFTIVMLHQGEEYQLLPSRDQKNTARFLARNGVDLVVSSHAHVVQPADLVPREEGGPDSMPVLTYGLGNYYCGQVFPNTRAGIMVSVKLIKGASSTRIAEAGFIPTYIFSRPMPDAGRLYRVLPMRQALADFRAGRDRLLTRDDAVVLGSELRYLVNRITAPSIPFRELPLWPRKAQAW